MAGNERILVILRALTGSGPAAAVQHALAEVTNQALSVSSQSTQFLGQAFDAAAEFTRHALVHGILAGGNGRSQRGARRDQQPVRPGSRHALEAGRS